MYGYRIFPISTPTNRDPTNRALTNPIEPPTNRAPGDACFVFFSAYLRSFFLICTIFPLCFYYGTAEHRKNKIPTNRAPAQGFIETVELQGL